MDLRQFIAQTKLEAKLPFDIDVDFVGGNFEGYPTERVGNLDIPKLDDLTHAEAFLFEAIGGVNENKLIEIRTEMLSLAGSLQAKFPELSVLEAYGLLFTPTELMEKADAKNKKRYNTVLESSQYADWLLVITPNLNKITELSKSRQSDINVDWLQITFFLISRLGNWDMNKTGSLTRKQMVAIKEFMALEANEGKTPIAIPNESTASNDVKQP